jgi:hypothetical protein
MDTRIDKLLATIAFALLGLALLVIVTTGAATGYEISIYAAYPPYFWFFLISSIVCGISILIRNAFSETRSRWWLAGLAAVLLTNIVFLMLPFFRGYFADGFYDLLNQIGIIRDIQLTGHFGAAGTPGENFYPSIHIIAVSIAHITGLTIELVAQIIPPIFFTFYIVSVYLLSKQITNSTSQAALITAFGALPLITSSNDSLATFIPRTMAFLLMPFILYLYYQARLASISPTAYATLLVMALVTMPFFHPYDGGLFLITILVCLDLSVLVYRMLSKHRDKELNTAFLPQTGSSIIPSFILLVIWFTWLSTFSMFSHGVRGVADWLVYHIGESEAQRYVLWLGRADIPLSDTIELFLKRHGQHLLYFAVSGVVSVIAWWKLLFSKSKPAPGLVVFSFLFAVWVVLLPVSFVISYELAYTRFIGYAILFSTLVNGLGVYWLYQRFGKRRLLTLATVFFLIIPLTLGVLNCYGSPFTAGFNDHVTTADMKGTSWFLEKRDEKLVADQITFNQFDYTSALLGRGSVPIDIRGIYEAEASMPEHFGYSKYSSYGAAIDKDRYFLSHKLDRIVYTERIPEYKAAWRWSPTDFERLESDPTVNRVYNSGQFEVFYVQGQGAD